MSKPVTYTHKDEKKAPGAGVRATRTRGRGGSSEDARPAESPVLGRDKTAKPPSEGTRRLNGAPPGPGSFITGARCCELGD